MLPSEYLQQGFCQNVMATDKFGNPAPTHGTFDEMKNFPREIFSIVGAINHSCSDDMYHNGTYNQLLRMTAVLSRNELIKQDSVFENLIDPNITDRENNHFKVIWQYNNFPGRTQKEAVELMQHVELRLDLKRELTK